MGADIFTFVEMRDDFNASALPFRRLQFLKNEWRYAQTPEILGDRNKAVFSLLLGDKASLAVDRPLPKPRGIPADASQYVLDFSEEFEIPYGHSWLLQSELLNVDYEQNATFEHYGSVERLPLRELLGKRYFEDLSALSQIGQPDSARLVFWFSW